MQIQQQISADETRNSTACQSLPSLRIMRRNSLQLQNLYETHFNYSFYYISDGFL